MDTGSIWYILGGLLGGAGGLMAVRWARRKVGGPSPSASVAPPAAPVGMSKEQADAAKDAAKAEHKATVAQAGEDLEGALKAIAEAQRKGQAP